MIEVRNLYKTFWLPQEVKALVDVSVSIAAGEVVVVIGPSGSGKSTLLWSGRNQPHFAPRSNMSQITGFDNRRMLPPYLPIIRGQDRLFGYMVDYVFPTSVSLEYPWAVPHLPLPDRKWRDRDLNFTPADSFPMFFVEKIIGSKSACLSTLPDDRLSSLSAWFKDMASASTNTLTSMYRDSRLHGDSASLEHLTALLKNTDPAPVKLAELPA